MPRSATILDLDTLELIQPLVEPLRSARRVVVLTGAGISAESGIPTFRDAMEGLWAKYDPAQLATPEAFEHDPGTVTRWYDQRRLRCASCQPNPGHHALARLQALLEQRGSSFTLLTQNVDRLHQRAGSRNVVELHGSIMNWRCTRTDRTVEPPSPPQEFATYPPPSPFDSQGLLRPDVVWFGEMLPEDALAAAHTALESCDLFISIGTSGVVQPAAGFVHQAAEVGAITAEINREPTAISRWVHWSIMGKSGDLLPALVRETFS